jgi:2-dehydro-3-deoxy-D-arabinonate dehydratase
MKLYRTKRGVYLISKGTIYAIDHEWDALINRNNLEGFLSSQLSGYLEVDPDTIDESEILPPIVSQEVWAAGVTYLKSRDARMEESHDSGSASLYDRVYDAKRPELFFKATPHRVAGHKDHVYIRTDSTWNVPEPELTLFINSDGSIQGYTVGNDMSSRSIEGENALYLPQAKIFDKCAGLGPCLYITSKPINRDSLIKMTIKRNSELVYEDSTPISRMKRALDELVGYLFLECDFPNGCFLMTGTCLVPPGDFTLQVNDLVEISIDGIGTLINYVGINPKHSAKYERK